MVKITLNSGDGRRNITFSSAYHPYDSKDPLPFQKLGELINFSQKDKEQLISRIDKNSHYRVWGSNNTNKRGE